MATLKISTSGPEYTHLTLLTEEQWESTSKSYNVLDISVETLQKLFEYEDVLQKYNIEQSPEGLTEYIELSEKGLEILSIVKKYEKSL